MGVGNHAGRTQQPDGEDADREAARAPEHAPRGDRRTCAAGTRAGRGVDQREDRRDQKGDEEELERPAAQHAVAGDEVGRAEARRLRPGVEGQRGQLRGRADAAQEVGGQGPEVAEDRLRGVRGGAQPRLGSVDPDHGGAAADERGLVAVHDRGHECRDLLAERGQAHRLHALVVQRLLDRAQPAGGRQAMALARQPEDEREAGAADGAQCDAGAQTEAGGRMASELARTCGLGRRAVDRGEHQRGLGDAADERARQLDERSRARAVVVGPRAWRQVVAPCDEDERIPRAAVARDDAQHVQHRHAAPVGVRGAEALDADLGARGAQALGDPVGRRSVARAAGGAIGEAVGDLVRGRQRLRAVERGRQGAARQGRRRACSDEQHERGHEHDQPAGPVGAGPEQRRGSRCARRTAAHARDARSALARGTLREHRDRVCMTPRDPAAAAGDRTTRLRP